MDFRPSHVRIGCDEIVNACALRNSRAWANLAGVPDKRYAPPSWLDMGCSPSSCCCPPEAPSRIGPPLVSGAPWADTANPASLEAFGFIADPVTPSALSLPPLASDPDQTREVTLVITAIATTRAGLHVLTNYLMDVLNDSCHPCGRTLGFNLFCVKPGPAEVCAGAVVDTGWRELAGCTVKSIERTTQAELAWCLEQFTIVFSTRCPDLWATPEPVIDWTTFDRSVIETCGSCGCVHGAPCRTFTTSPSQASRSWFPSWCDSWSHLPPSIAVIDTHRRIGKVAPIIELNGGTTGLANARVDVWTLPEGAHVPTTIDELAPIVCHEPCWSLAVREVPPMETLTLDPRCGTATVTCGDVCLNARRLVATPGRAGITWPDLRTGRYLVVVTPSGDIDPEGVPVTAVDAQWRLAWAETH